MNKQFCKAFVLHFGLLFVSVSFANSPIDNYLLTTSDDMQSVLTEQTPLAQSAWNSWVDDTQVRFGDNDISDSQNQSYSLRLSLKNIKQHDAERNLLKLASKRGQVEKNNFRLTLLYKKYLNILSVVQLKQKTSELQQQLDIANLEMSAYSQLVMTDIFDPSKVQKVNLDIERLNLLLKRKQQSLSQALNLLGISGDDSHSAQQIFDYSQWLVSINSIIDFIETDRSFENHPSLKKLQLATKISKQRLTHERASTGLTLDLLEVKYDVDKDAYGATVGIRIPLGKSNFDSLMRQNSYQQSQLALDIKHHSMADKLLSSKQTIRDDYEQYKQEVKLASLLEDRLKRMQETAQPGLIVTLKKEKQQYQSMSEESYFRILREYINYLNISGLIVEMPMRNWLQQHMPVIAGTDL